MSAGWTAYPGVLDLAAHLRFGLIPCDFSIWLCRDEWDPAYQDPKTAEMIFEGAQAECNRYVEDIPLMKKVIAELDKALEARGDETWRHLETACRRFNARWKSTPTWNFEHKPLRDVKALARDIRRSQTTGNGEKDEIRVLAAASVLDIKAQRRLRSYPRDAAVI
jgi:hypothetical protein